MNSAKDVEVISLLDDSDTEDTSCAAVGKRGSPTSVATGTPGAHNKRRKKKSGSNDFVSSPDAIEIIDSGDEGEQGGDDNMMEDTKPSISNAAAASKKTDEEANDNSDVAEVSSMSSALDWRPVSSSASSSAASSSSSSVARGNLKDDRAYDDNNDKEGTKEASEKNDEDEFEIVATKGQNALADFPHSRANCVTHPFATCGDKKLHCINCYCYVCDIPATDCMTWQTHCEASHDDRHWREEREKFKRRARQAALAPASTPAPVDAAAAAAAARSSSHSSSSSSSASTSSGTGGRAQELSVRKLLEKVTTVHPVEMEPPAGSAFISNLRHYQKQSLAFMVDVERGAGGNGGPNKTRGGWLADEVGMGKSAVVIALVVTNPASPKVLASEQVIRDHVRTINEYEQEEADSVAAHRERCSREREEAFSDDYGSYKRQMGILSEQQERRWDEIQDSLSEKRDAIDRIKLKTSVVFTSLSLMGQWEDEIKKHAPGLVVKTFHPSRKKNSEFIDLSKGHRGRRHVDQADVDTILELSKADVVISTSTFHWPMLVRESFEFHRVVQDESHLFSKGPSAKEDIANMIFAARRWGVTATPMASSTSELLRQLTFIQAGSLDDATTALRNAISNFQYWPTEQSFNRLAEILQKFMIRHTKFQRINGSEALSLPPSTTTTVMLNMSRDEDHSFNCVKVSAATFSKHYSSGAKTFTVENCFAFNFGSVLRSGAYPNMSERVCYGKKMDLFKFVYKPEWLTKVAALRTDLASLREVEPQLRAVVFTQFRDVHNACVRGLERDGFEVFQFTGGSASQERDEAIRKFQGGSSDKPAVFVVTLRTANVGITLTAASRVYLLEPCLDPAVEVQAAGRIHRLGQDKACQVIKYAFKNSYESNIIDLHKEILAGRIAIVDGFVPHEAMKILAKGIRRKRQED